MWVNVELLLNRFYLWQFTVHTIECHIVASVSKQTIIMFTLTAGHENLRICLTSVHSNTVLRPFNKNEADGWFRLNLL